MTLYLPSELHNRDWDARLLIAAHATALGHSCVVGQQWALNANVHNLPPGIVLIKTTNEIQMSVAKSYRNAGHIVCTMDEEAYAMAPDQEWIGLISPRLAQVSDFFYANSPLHAEAMKQRVPELNVVPTGNARTDLLSKTNRQRFAKDADRIRADLGPFILFNSNMGLENSIWTDRQQFMDIQVRAGVVDPSDPESVKRFNQTFEFERSNTEAFIEAVKWCLENIPTHKIVVRPHPAERTTMWHKLARGNPRLKIVEGQRHIPWIMASEAVVHTNSTTGVEAALLGKPTVNLVPNANGFWENVFVTTRVNRTYSDWLEGVQVLRDGTLLPNSRSELDRYYPQQDAARAIAQHMAANDRHKAAHIKLGPYQHHDIYRQKFTKELSEAEEDFRAFAPDHAVRFEELAESCFAIHPTTSHRDFIELD